MEMNNIISEQEQNRKVLFLKIKICKNKSGIFYISEIKKEYNIIMKNSTYLIINKNNIILKLDMQSKIDDGEIILFNIRKSEYYKLEKPVFYNSVLTENNINALNYCLWYTVRSEKPNEKKADESNNNNDDYYLHEKDIIRFGNFKLILQEIHFENYIEESIINHNKNGYNIEEINMNNKKRPIFNLEPYIEQYITKDKDKDIFLEDDIKCEICEKKTYSEDNPLIRFCLCEKFKHYECIKEEIKKKYTKPNYKERENMENKENPICNYYINNFCRKKCNAIYPLRFKIEGINKIYELFEIKKPKNKDYLIFESLPYYSNGDYEISIHIITLTGNNNDEENMEIKIGKVEENHIKIVEKNVSRKHAKIIYNKKNRSLLLKNLSKTSGSLVLIKNSLTINEKKINLQVGRTSIEASLMNEEDAINGNKIDLIQTQDEYKKGRNKKIIYDDNDNDNDNNIDISSKLKTE